MYKLEFILKQHTPLIHFQHDQAGATLRATEVKPKLDKFIIERMGGIDKLKADYPEWLIDEGKHEALDYKLRIEKPTDICYYLPLALNPNSQSFPNKGRELVTFIKEKLEIDVTLIAPSPYFANSDKIKFQYNSELVDERNTKVSELKFAIKTEQDFNGYISSYNQVLLDVINENISRFFLLHNFGTRQSKGFGSYMTIDPPEYDQTVIDKIPSSFGLEGLYYKEYSSLNNQTTFTEINNFWKILKAGDSFRHYQKSDIFNYFYNLNPKIRWEKRALKKEMKANYKVAFNELKYDKGQTKSRILCETDQQDNHFFVRALLGLAENNEFGTFSPKDNVKIQISDKLSNNPHTKAKAIERFKSPITFKRIGNRIYMFVYKVNGLLQTDIDGNDREFEFLLNASIKDIPSSGLLTTLKVPKNFSVVQFLDSPKYETATGLSKNISIAKDFGFIKL
jgi:curved DNA-binding protein CbpA